MLGQPKNGNRDIIMDLKVTDIEKHINSTISAMNSHLVVTGLVDPK